MGSQWANSESSISMPMFEPVRIASLRDQHVPSDLGLAAPAPQTLPPLSLYIHLPWCLRKCPYCDFNSHEIRSPPALDVYVDSLLIDLEQALPWVWGRSVVSIFMGGGTPNVFPPSLIDRLLAGVRARLKILPGAEVTLEANPAGAQAECADWQAYRQAGVTRISVGVQSFNSDCLQVLGRLHSAHQAEEAAIQAVECFDRVNIDLMYGLPGQTLAMAKADLSRAMALGVGHISLYQLTLEPNTFFSRYPPVLPDEDLIWQMQTELLGMLEHAGFARYEVSAFSRPDQICQHNLNYWEFGDYLGIGAGAHGKLSHPTEGIVRQVCLRNPQNYMEALGQKRHGLHRQTQPVKASDLLFEFMLNGLRLVEGISVTAYSERTGRPIEDLLPAMREATEKGLLETAAGRLKPSAMGMNFLNDLQAVFLHQK